MKKTPDINWYLRQHPRDCKRGAPMGASNIRPDDLTRLYVQRINFTDGDYAPDGTYWGKSLHLWCAFSADYISARVYVRAPNRLEAIRAVIAMYPDAGLQFTGVSRQCANVGTFIRTEGL